MFYYHSAVASYLGYLAGLSMHRGPISIRSLSSRYSCTFANTLWSHIPNIALASDTSKKRLPIDRFVNADHWRKNLPVLAEAGFRVYAIDLLGSGYSSLDPESRSTWAPLKGDLGFL